MVGVRIARSGAVLVFEKVDESVCIRIAVLAALVAGEGWVIESDFRVVLPIVGESVVVEVLRGWKVGAEALGGDDVADLAGWLPGEGEVFAVLNGCAPCFVKHFDVVGLAGLKMDGG